MAAVSPNIVFITPGIPVVKWEAANSTDGASAYALNGRLGLSAAIQVVGTFGGATVKLQVSVDGVTYYDLSDTAGNPISATAAGIFEFSTSAVYIKPDISGGTGDDLDIFVALRGPASNT